MLSAGHLLALMSNLHAKAKITSIHRIAGYCHKATRKYFPLLCSFFPNIHASALSLGINLPNAFRPAGGGKSRYLQQNAGINLFLAIDGTSGPARRVDPPSPTEKRPRAGVSHDHFHFVPVFRTVAVFGTLAALRLGVKVAINPHDDGMSEEACAVLTQGRSIPDDHRYLFILKGEGFPLPVPVVGVTVHGDKPGEFVGVSPDLFVTVDLDFHIWAAPGGRLFHTSRLPSAWKRFLDGGQRRDIRGEKSVFRGKNLRYLLLSPPSVEALLFQANTGG